MQAQCHMTSLLAGKLFCSQYFAYINHLHGRLSLPCTTSSLKAPIFLGGVVAPCYVLLMTRCHNSTQQKSKPLEYTTSCKCLSCLRHQRSPMHSFVCKQNSSLITAKPQIKFNIITFYAAYVFISLITNLAQEYSSKLVVKEFL